MSKEMWKTHRLGDLCTKIGSGATPRGGKEAYLDEGPFALVRSQNVLDFFCSTDGLAFINQEQANLLSNVELKERDVLLNITGDSVARVCQIPSSLIPGRVNQHVSIIRPDELKLIPEFLKYYLLNPSFKNYMLGLASVGGTRNALTKGMIEEFEIEVPPHDTQRRIAAILSTLDEKIELNRQTNATLETIAQALFKEWFVDFRFPGATGKMKDSEVGLIPKGWKIKRLGEIVTIQNGYAFKSSDFIDDGDAGIIKIKNIGGKQVDVVNTQFVLNKIVENLNANFKIDQGSLLIAMTGANVGKIGLVPDSYKPLWLNQRVGMFREKIEYANDFLYILLGSEEYQSLLRNSALGSAQPNISATTIENIAVLLPPNDLIVVYGEIAHDIFKRILLNVGESSTLSFIRNALLPKLINGDIEV